MCEALAQNGNDVTLVVKSNTKWQEAAPEGDHYYYGVEPNFKIKKIARPAYKGGGVLYLLDMLRYVLAGRREIDIVFSRDVTAAYFTSLIRLPFIFESHGILPSKMLRWQFSKIIKASTLRRLIIISNGLKKDLAAINMLPPENKIKVLHDGAKPFNLENGKDPKFELDGRFKIGYVGQLYKGRGIEMIISLARRLPDTSFHIIGGEDHDLKRWQSEDLPGNVYFHGFISPGEINIYYRQFDLLLLPYQRQVFGSSGQSELSRWMSPMKLFEYMSSGKPFISSNNMVLQEILKDEENALLVQPDDVDAWETAVRRLQSDPDLAKRLGTNARQDLIDHYTWLARARQALDGIEV
jgi:glycosyltransferase involved in cell wall biosynthesis